MSGNRWLLDSNTVIYLSKGLLNGRALFKDEDQVFISLVTYMEVLGFTAIQEEELSRINQFFLYTTLLPIDINIAHKVIEIRKKRRIKIPDAIIAATTLLEDCILITKNVADFSGIVPDEKVLDPSFN